MVQKTTLYLVALACLAAGFVGGVIYSAAKNTPVAVSGQAAGQAQPPAIPEKIAAVIAQLQAQVAKEPGNYEAWVRLGNAYFDSHQPHEAIEAYKQALAIDDSSADVWTDLGVMYRRHKEPEKAVESFDEAYKRNPRHITCRFNKGLVLLYDLNDKAGAIRAWEEAVAINPQATAPNGRLISELLAELKKQG